MKFAGRYIYQCSSFSRFSGVRIGRDVGLDSEVCFHRQLDNGEDDARLHAGGSNDGHYIRPLHQVERTFKQLQETIQRESCNT